MLKVRKFQGKGYVKYKNDEKERKWLLVFAVRGMGRGGTRCDLVSICRCHPRFLSAEYRVELEELVRSFLPEARCGSRLMSGIGRLGLCC